MILITLPVYNEEQILERSVEKLVSFLEDKKIGEFEILIVDNGSTDRTGEIGKRLEKKYLYVNLLSLPEKGRGAALRSAWKNSDADIVSYMDIDLSTDLRHFLELIGYLDRYDIATGSRLHKKSRTVRRFYREFLSMGYSLFARILLGYRVRDSQCGFKALKTDVFKKIEPLIEDNDWFFDTELLYIAHKKGYKIEEIPVRWVENTDSSVDVIPTVLDYIKNILRLRSRKI